MDDLHLQADLFFGPCNDPDCPGSQATSKPRLDLVWSTREQSQSLDDAGQ